MKLALQKKLTSDEKDLLAIIVDPILLTEFLNNTNYGDTNKNNWKRGEEFKLRPFQRELITDKTKNIVVAGGRSIGKCQPASARVYTTDGYQSIHKLKDLNHFSVYAPDEKNELHMRRAVITKDVKKPVYTIITASGNIIQGTDVHPLLTRKGYLLLDALKVGDEVAVARRLPTTHLVLDILEWHEARLFGYMSLAKTFPAMLDINPRYEAIKEELRFMCKKFYCNFFVVNKRVQFRRKMGGTYKHPINYLKRQFGYSSRNVEQFRNLDYIKNKSIRTVKIFLEAMFAQYAHLTRDRVYIDCVYAGLAEDLQELLLYFGIESKWDRETHRVSLLDKRAHYLFWSLFTLPGVEVGKLIPPATEYNDLNDYFRWDKIAEIRFDASPVETYSVHVYKDETYIGDGIANHNSVVLENLIIAQIVNSSLEFPETAEQVLATPNQNQLTPLLDKIIRRFDSSPFLKSFQVAKNLSKGTFDYYISPTRQHRMFARIAGSKSEQNIVGLHVSRIAVDEGQLFPMPTWFQMQPILNTWEQNAQQLYTGVHNGMRNMVLFQLDQKTPSFKKYRIPSPNNPYFTYQDWVDAIKRYGGEDTDLFQQLVLAKPGSASFSVINRDAMIFLPVPFYSYRFTSSDKAKGKAYKDVLQLPKLFKNHEGVILGIDTGFVDPTIIQLFVKENNVWRVFARWKLTRIEFPEQEEIIDWIATAYQVGRIGLDVGAGGGGSGMVQSFTYRPEYAHGRYISRIVPINFAEAVNVADPEKEETINVPFKTYAGNQLAQIIESGGLAFSELDNEGISQIERIAKQKSPSGVDRFFIMSDKGTGVSTDDHIFASYITFMGALNAADAPTVKKLGMAATGKTNK